MTGARELVASLRAFVVPEGRFGRLLVLLGLTGFAIAQPLLAVLGDNPAVFSLRGVDGWWLVAFALIVGFVPPLALWCVATVTTRVSRRAGDVVYIAMVALLSAMTAVQWAKTAGLRGSTAVLAVGLLALVGMPYLYVRHRLVAAWVRYTSVLPVAAVSLFLFGSATGEVLLTATSEAAPAASDSGLPPVIMIVLDEFPTSSILDSDREVDGTRFPNLARFATDSTWYRHYTAMAPFTASALPSMLTGTIPRPDRPLYTNHPNSIFRLLADTHEVHAIETATALCNVPGCRPDTPADLGAALSAAAEMLDDRLSISAAAPRDLDEFVDAAAPAEAEADAAQENFEITARPRSVNEFIASLDDPTDGRPAFRYLHLMLPHQPWQYYPDGSRYTLPPNPFATLAAADAAYDSRWATWPATVTQQRHLLQASYTDTLLGVVLDALATNGTYDESLVVVAADHGISFGPRTPAREPTLATIGDIAYVPLFIKTPHQDEGRIDDDNLMSVDLLPTIAGELGLPIDWEIDGHPAGSPEIAARGDTKEWIDIVSPFAPRLLGSFEYSDAESFPDPAERLVGPLTDPDDPLSALLGQLDIADVLGRGLDELAPAASGGVTLDLPLANLRRPAADEPPGVVTGVVTGHPGAVGTSIFVLEVNGSIVSGSPVFSDSRGDARVEVLLPSGVLTDTNIVRAALVTFVGVVELEIE